MCGNALAGLRSASATLVAPLYDDCLHFLVSHTRGDRGSNIDGHTLYYTEGWLGSERSLDKQYYELADRCGEAKADRVFQHMLKGYCSMSLIDTGAYNMEDALMSLRKKSALFGLEAGTVTGTLRVIKKLLTHQWDEEFYVAEPGRAFNAIDFLRRAE